jgi:hypothetical protein
MKSKSFYIFLKVLTFHGLVSVVNNLLFPFKKDNVATVGKRYYAQIILL